MKPKKDVKFEQGFLTEAFGYTLRDEVGECDKMLRTLRSLLVQTKVADRFKDKIEPINARLDLLEARPVEGIHLNIYAMCSVLRNGTDELRLWKNGRPWKLLPRGELEQLMRITMDELTKITGELSEILDVAPLQMGKRSFGWMKKGGDKDVAH